MRTARGSSRPRGGSASVHAGIHNPPPPGVGLETPPTGCLPRDPPGQTPQLSPGCGPGDPPPEDLQGMLGYHLQCMLGYLTAPDRCYCLNQASLTCNKGRAGEFPVGEDQ